MLARQVRLIGTEERLRFDDFIASSPKGHILQSYPWGEVKARTGWRPWRLVVEEDGSVVAALTILSRRLPGLGKAIFYAPRGPVLDLRRQDHLDCLLEAVRNLARSQQAFLLKTDPDVPALDKEFRHLFASRGFRPSPVDSGFAGVQPRCVFRLDLTPSPDELFAALHPKTRYNIRLAQRNGVVVEEVKQKVCLPVFYRLLQETAARDRFLIRSYDYFEAIWDELVVRDYARLFLAHYDGESIAGTLAFVLGDKAWYIYGASSNRHRRVMPNYLLQWEMILWAKERGCRMYDFRGVPASGDDSDPLYGLYRFKKGFGGQFTEFAGDYDLVFSPFHYKIWQMAEAVYEGGVKRVLTFRRRLAHR